MLAAASWLPVAALVWVTAHLLTEIELSPALGGRCRSLCLCVLSAL